MITSMLCAVQPLAEGAAHTQKPWGWFLGSSPHFTTTKLCPVFLISTPAWITPTTTATHHVYQGALSNSDRTGQPGTPDNRQTLS